MALDHKKFQSITEIQSAILTHLIHNEHKYKHYHEGDICKDTEAYFNSGVFTQDIADIVVHAIPAALNLNVYIYQKGPDSNVQVTENFQNGNCPTIHLFFDYNKNYDGGNHYMSIVKLCTPENASRVLSFNNDTLSVCSQTSQSSTESLSCESDSYDQYKCPTQLFAGIEPEPVDFLPGDINGMKVFRLQATSRNCWKVASDLRYFKMHTISKKGLTGKRKVGMCMGNTICNNDACSYKRSCKDQFSNTLYWEYLDGKKICKH